MTDFHVEALPAFIEHRVRGAGGELYVRDFPGRGPAFVMLHGFPDNSHIYDAVIPHLVAGRRRAVTLDFLGYGASDKPDGAVYGFEQQLGDLEATVAALDLGRIVPVGHDSGGPAAVNFALRNPAKVAGLCLMNAFYGHGPGQRVPEFIELFSSKNLKALSRHFLASPQQFGWLLGFQRNLMQVGLNDRQKALYDGFLGPIVDRNFSQQPGAGAAFGQMTYQLQEQLDADTARLPDFRRFDLPLLMIWGIADPYLHVSVAEHLRSQAKHGTLHRMAAGHWPQIDEAADTAKIMLAAQWG